ncbi:hypothetical protein PM082_016388 [Marasmius tenuissimus]|nr:hypothetical protein PM082_016388 [Marasmius tenuissimus]
MMTSPEAFSSLFFPSFARLVASRGGNHHGLNSVKASADCKASDARVSNSAGQKDEWRTSKIMAVSLKEELRPKPPMKGVGSGDHWSATISFHVPTVSTTFTFPQSIAISSPFVTVTSLTVTTA